MSDIWNEVDGVLCLPDSWRDEAAALAAEHKTDVLTLLRRRVELNHDSAALLKGMRHLARLLQERVARPGGEWLDAAEVAQRLRMTKKAIYCSVERSGPLAQAATRVGRRLRFSREAVDALLRGSLRPARRSVLIPARDTSPARSGR